MIFVLSLVWGGSFFFTEIALLDFQPLTVVFLRVSLAALALLVFVHVSGHRMPWTVTAWIPFFIMGGLNNFIPFSLIVWGQTHIDSGLASILNATTPLFSVILAHYLTTGERMTFNRLTGVLLGIIGVGVLMSPNLAEGIGGSLFGQMAILGAACSYSFAGIYGKRLSVYPTSVAATGMLCASSLLTAPMMLVFERPFDTSPELTTWGAIIGVALLSTAFAYLLYFAILARAGATNLLLVTFLIPPSAMTLGILFLDEIVTTSAIGGMALIFAGLAAVDGRLPKKIRSALFPS